MSILSLFKHLVNGGYSKWSLSVPCNVSCGEGMEIWRRTCDNPEPKYGGSNCSELGKSAELRQCNKKRCPGGIELAMLVKLTIILFMNNLVIFKRFFGEYSRDHRFVIQRVCRGKPN